MSEQLWAPWRLAYIKGEKEEGCIFCVRMARPRDEEDLILHRGTRSLVILNAFPYSNGHLMVVPYEHSAALELLADETMTEMNQLLKRSMLALRSTMNPNGFNIGYNIGRCAGAGVLDHVHQHVVPRWDGDTNFMPVLADTAVLPQLLSQTWKMLKDAF